MVVTGTGFTANLPVLTLVVDEDAANGTVVGQLGAVDPNVGDTHSYTLVDDAGGRFSITAGGEIRVADGAALESATSHDITVRVTDGGGLTYDEVFTIAVDGDNEAPAFTIGDGLVLTDFGAGDDQGKDVAVQPDGKMIVVGKVTAAGGQSDRA